MDPWTYKIKPIRLVILSTDHYHSRARALAESTKSSPVIRSPDAVSVMTIRRVTLFWTKIEYTDFIVPTMTICIPDVIECETEIVHDIPVGLELRKPILKTDATFQWSIWNESIVYISTPRAIWNIAIISVVI